MAARCVCVICVCCTMLRIVQAHLDRTQRSRRTLTFCKYLPHSVICNCLWNEVLCRSDPAGDVRSLSSVLRGFHCRRFGVEAAQVRLWRSVF